MARACDGIRRVTVGLPPYPVDPDRDEMLDEMATR